MVVEYNFNDGIEGMKKTLLAGFFLSVLAFVVSFLYAPESNVQVIALHSSIFFLGLFFLYEKSWKKTLKRLGVPGNLKNNVKYFIGGLAMIILSVIALNVLFYSVGANDSANITETVQQLPFYIVLFGIVVAPVTEEVFFRAFLVEKTGIWISSGIFALSHVAYGSVVELAGAFVIGIILAVVYRRSASLVPVVAIHFVFNLVSILAIHGGTV
ncbi:MAG TPA: type II CAAX endopeptidase family protein [Candidatus Bilamarchaeaceae archaeon]|nr:type II CAAX endopeptidase family protein [Candidatus Bilamarchaeaceae archaeon]